MEVHGIAFVEGVNLSPGWNLNLFSVSLMGFPSTEIKTYVGMCEDEFTQ